MLVVIINALFGVTGSCTYLTRANDGDHTKLRPKNHRWWPRLHFRGDNRTVYLRGRYTRMTKLRLSHGTLLEKGRYRMETSETSMRKTEVC